MNDVSPRRQAFTNLYRTLDRAVVVRQGRLYLEQRSDTLAERARRLAVVFAVTTVIAGVVIYLAFVAWLVVLAYQIGAGFSSLHHSAFAYLLLP